MTLDCGVMEEMYPLTVLIRCQYLIASFQSSDVNTRSKLPEYERLESSACVEMAQCYFL